MAFLPTGKKCHGSYAEWRGRGAGGEICHLFSPSFGLVYLRIPVSCLFLFFLEILFYPSLFICLFLLFFFPCVFPSSVFSFPFIHPCLFLISCLFIFFNLLIPSSSVLICSFFPTFSFVSTSIVYETNLYN